MVDFHTHILPHMDDGSRSVAQSLQMLALLQKQGVDTVCLTSHFLADESSVEGFLRRRQASWEALRDALPENHPRLLLGAEVQYRLHLAELPGLHRLCLQGTRVLLLEMRFRPWDENTVREVCALAESGYTVMLAHTERYMPLQKPRLWQRLADCGVIFQSNAEIFLPPLMRGGAIYLFKHGYIQVLGTDTHDLLLRSPHMDLALDLIARELGDNVCRAFREQSDRYLAAWQI